MQFLPIVIMLIVACAIGTIGVAGIMFFLFMVPAPIIAAIIATIAVWIWGDI